MNWSRQPSTVMRQPAWQGQSCNLAANPLRQTTSHRWRMARHGRAPFDQNATRRAWRERSDVRSTERGGSVGRGYFKPVIEAAGTYRWPGPDSLPPPSSETGRWSSLPPITNLRCCERPDRCELFRSSCNAPASAASLRRQTTKTKDYATRSANRAAQHDADQ